MGKPNKAGEASEFDEILSDALGGAEGEPEEDSPVQAAPEPAADPAPEPESEPDPVVESDDGGEAPEPVAAEATPAPNLSGLERERDGLLRELTELRMKNRKLSADASLTRAPNPAQQAGAPAPPQMPQPQAQPEQGDLADMISYADGRAGIDTQKLNEYIDRRTAPDPAAQRAQQDAETYRGFKSEFVARNPALNSAVMDHAEQAYQFLTDSVMLKANEWNVDVGSMGLDQFIQFAQDTGAMDDVGRHFPHLAGDMPSLLAASALSSVGEMDRVLSRYSERLGGALGAMTSGGVAPLPAASHAPAPGAPPAIPATPQAPNLTGVGTVTPEPTLSGKSRLEELRQKDVVFDMSDKEYRELEKLEEKFG